MKIDLLRRLDRVERQVNETMKTAALEQDLEDMAEKIDLYAEMAGVTSDLLREEVRDLVKLQIDLGDDAFYRYMALELDVPLETMLDRVKREAFLSRALEV